MEKSGYPHLYQQDRQRAEGKKWGPSQIFLEYVIICSVYVNHYGPKCHLSPQQDSKGGLLKFEDGHWHVVPDDWQVIYSQANTEESCVIFLDSTYK